MGSISKIKETINRRNLCRATLFQNLDKETRPKKTERASSANKKLMTGFWIRNLILVFRLIIFKFKRIKVLMEMDYRKINFRFNKRIIKIRTSGRIHFSPRCTFKTTVVINFLRIFTHHLMLPLIFRKGHSVANLKPEMKVKNKKNQPKTKKKVPPP